MQNQFIPERNIVYKVLIIFVNTPLYCQTCNNSAATPDFPRIMYANLSGRSSREHEIA